MVSAHTAGGATSRRWIMPALGVAVAAAVLTTWAISAGTDRSTTVTAPTSSVVPVFDGVSETSGTPAGDPTQRTATQRDTVVLWPDPPIDHVPHVLGRPGDGPLVPGREDITLVYVNSIGRPTVLDLGTGDREELDVADGRLRDTFEIDGGHVVIGSGRGADVAGPDAVTVQVHRPRLFAIATPPPTGPTIDLCLGDVCPQLAGDHEAARTSERIELLEPDEDPELAGLLSGAGGRDGRFDTVDVGGRVIRIPTPGDGPIWMVRDR